MAVLDRRRAVANWAGNQTGERRRSPRPTSTAELAAVVRGRGRRRAARSRPVGSGHSFTAAAATDGRPDRADRLAGTRRRRPGRTAGHRVRPAPPWPTSTPMLAAHGLALPNLGDIDAQTISGALSTGTHGTGAGVRLPLHLRRGARHWSPATVRSCAARPTTQPGRLRRRPGRRRRARRASPR